jgi:hypothetical protein
MYKVKLENLIRGLLILFALGVLCFNIIEMSSNIHAKQGKIYVLEALSGILLIFVPEALEKIFSLKFTRSIIYFYWLFLWLSIYLGTCLQFMSRMEFWDKLLHVTSPILLTMVGYGVIGAFLNETDKTNISPMLFIIFGFAFAALCGVLWEFWEFGWDGIGNMNLQRYLQNGKPLIGRKALFDTMGDLLANTVGAVIIAVYTGIKSKNDANYFERYKIKSIK